MITRGPYGPPSGPARAAVPDGAMVRQIEREADNGKIQWASLLECLECKPVA